jgi:hypothetical protein
MLKFFRTIRKKLIEQANIRKYLLYAIGEILLVVIGILIALQVNTWNEQRKLNLREISYYESLLQDLQTDSTEYDFRKRNAGTNAAKMLNIIDFIDNGHNLDGLTMREVMWRGVQHTDTLALVMSLAQAGFLQFPQIYDHTITDLKTTGNLKLLKNKPLKDAILYYYNLHGLHQQWAETYLPVRTEIDKTINAVLPPHIRVSYLNEDPFYASKDEIIRIVQNMKANTGLKELANGMYHTHWRIIWRADQRLGNLRELRNDVRSEIARLK